MMMNKPLPTKAYITAPINLERFVTATTMGFFAGDVCYQFMHESTSLLLRDHKDLKPETRRRVNHFIDCMNRAKKAACEVGADVMGLSDQQTDYFFEDAQYIKNIIAMIYDKTKHGKNNNAEKIKQFLTQLE